MTDLAVLGPIDRVRLSSRLLAIREQLSGTGLGALERVRLSAEGIRIRNQLLGEIGSSATDQSSQIAFEKAKAFYQKNLKGRVVQSVIGPVRINGTGWKKMKFGMKADTLKAQLVEHIVDILQSGNAGERQESYKDRRDDLVAFYFITKEIQLDSLLVRAGITVGEDSQGNLFYNISHSGTKNWTEYKNGTPDYARVEPRSKGAADETLDSVQAVLQQNSGSVDSTLADGDLNITILSITPIAQPTPPAESGQVKVSEAPQYKSSAEQAKARHAESEARARQAAATKSLPELEQAIAEADAELEKYQRAINLGALSPAALAALDQYSEAKQALDLYQENITWENAKSRPIPTASSKPHTVAISEVLTPAGSLKADATNSRADTAIWYYQGNVQHLSFTANVTINGEKDKNANYAKETLQKIKAAKDYGFTLRNYRAGRLGTVWVLESEDGKSFLTRTGFDETINPVFERPEMPADAPGYENMLAQQIAIAKKFVTWLDTLPYEQRHNQGVVSRKIGSTPIGKWASLSKDSLGLTLIYQKEDRSRGIRVLGKDFDDLVAKLRKLAVMPEIEPKQATDDLPGETTQPSSTGQEPPTSSADQTLPPTDAPAIIEYTTRRGKNLRGVIRTDLTKAEAQAIDPYTWRMNGGYFIREQYLSGDTSQIQASPVPVVLSPEQEAEKQARDERQAEEQRQQSLINQVNKLRDIADKAVDSGESGMTQERKTNTSRRAGMAAAAFARASQDEADGRTLHSIADAIEVGAAGPLAKLTSRSQLQELKRAISLAKYESEKGLSYAEQQALRGREVSEDDLQHVTFPIPLVWASRYRDAALIIAKKAAKGNSRLIASLTKLGKNTERFRLSDPADIAVTRRGYKVLQSLSEGYTLQDCMESMAHVDRLNRMGISNSVELRGACRALLPHLSARKEESAVAKAERAIIGQKVGIDFFPTPANVAQRMARLARISKGDHVLEPSAGNGNLADAAAAEGANVDVIEISSQLRDILTAKGYNVVDHDFMEFTPEKPYDAILMNPPFSKRQDAEHIMRAYGMLKAGGTLVAIAGEGVFFGQDQKAQQFRTWLESHHAEVEKLDGGTFTDTKLLAQTGANARLIVIRK